MFVLQLIRPSSPKGFSRNIRGQLGSQIRWFNKFVSANKSRNFNEFSFGVKFFDFFNRSPFFSGYRHHNASGDVVVDLDEIPIDDDLVGGGGDPNEMNLAVRSFNRYY